jgi:hypothetical protein
VCALCGWKLLQAQENDSSRLQAQGELHEIHEMRKAAIDHTSAPSVRGASRKETRTTVQGGLSERDEFNSTSQMLAARGAAHVQMDSDGLR